MEEKEIGLYIHIPFCKQKCYYCDFVSFSNKKRMVKRYVMCIENEIKKVAHENKILAEHGLEPVYVLKTIYIGGGTPSVINEMYIGELLNTVKNSFMQKNEIEVTIEVNPGTVTKENLKKYFEYGVNRLSIGLQATQNRLLKEIGRIHTYEEFELTYKNARDVGFKNINVDLMIGLPNQSIEDVKESTRKILKLKPEHISVYSLIVEENTKMEELVLKKKVVLPEDKIEREMYWYVKSELEKKKYCHYEISNFAKRGFESKHNTDCWNQNEYIGVGTAACSFLNNARYGNTENLEEYIQNIENKTPSKNIILQEILDEESKMNEYMMLSLRKIDGVSISEFKKRFNQNPIMKYSKTLKKLIDENLIQIDKDRIMLSKKGIDLANLVWEEFI